MDEVPGEEAAAKGKAKKKVPKVPKPAEPRIKWSYKEDMLLAQAWMMVSLDPIIGANQNMENYWKRVKTSYDERRIVDPEYASCLDRGEKAMANHWAVIQHACNKWHGIQEECLHRPKSGSNSEMEVSSFSP